MAKSARMQIRAQVEFIPLAVLGAPRAPDDLMDAARKSGSGKIKSLDETKGKYVAIFYDPKLSGEATHRPAIRQPPFRKDPYSQLIKMLQARSIDNNPPEQDAYFTAARKGSTTSS